MERKRVSNRVSATRIASQEGGTNMMLITKKVLQHSIAPFIDYDPREVHAEDALHAVKA